MRRESRVNEAITATRCHLTVLTPHGVSGLVSGLGVSVVYIDANLQFDLKRLAAILDLNLSKKSQGFSTDGSKSGRKRVNTERFIKSCLDRLHLLQPTDSDELIVALAQLHDSFLMNHERVGLVILDSLNAFYWLERPVDDVKSVKFYDSPQHKKICASLASLVGTYKVNLFVSLANIFRGRDLVKGAANETMTKEECDAAKDDFWTNHEWRKLRTFKLKLCKTIVYQDKNDGIERKDADASAAEKTHIDRRSTMDHRIGKIPNQLVAYTLFNCLSKKIDNRGEFLIKGAGFTNT